MKTKLAIALVALLLSACGSQDSSAPAADSTTTPPAVNDPRTVINNVQCSYVDGPVTLGFKLRQYEDGHWEGFATAADSSDVDPQDGSLTSTWDGASNKPIEVNGFVYTFYSTGMMWGVTDGSFSHAFGTDCTIWQ